MLPQLACMLPHSFLSTKAVAASPCAPDTCQSQVAYGWVIKSATDGTPKATATGQTTTVLLPPGLYVVTLNVVDNTGASSTQGPLQFRVTGPGQSSNTPGIGPNAIMVAKIASPPPIVIAGPEVQGGNKSINLDASGSTPSPGHLIDRYIWTVTTAQPGNMQIVYNATVRQANAAFVELPVGSYIVSLVMIDTSGRNSSITQVSGVLFTGRAYRFERMQRQDSGMLSRYLQSSQQFLAWDEQLRYAFNKEHTFVHQ
jgi:hypothetical protein